jgi:hypothetical protein
MRQFVPRICPRGRACLARLAIATLAAGSLAMSGCGGGRPDQASDKHPLIIGISLSDSGDFADPSQATSCGRRPRTPRAASLGATSS